MMRHARYEILDSETTDESLVIRDIGPWDTFKTVTNDAESVVRFLVGAGLLQAGQRLFYYDSDGDLDEILVSGGTFVGFKSTVLLRRR